MNEISWVEAFFPNKSLKDLRTEYNIELPMEYINSSRKLTMAFAIWLFMFGYVLGYLLRGL